jgi:hypothetical protein
MLTQPESALSGAAATSPGMAKLGRALANVADVLAELSPAEFDALARQEAADLPLVFAYFEATGWPTMFPPERWLGHRILELYAQRHPLLATDGDGTA